MNNIIKPNKATCDVCNKETYPTQLCTCPERQEDGSWAANLCNCGDIVMPHKHSDGRIDKPLLFQSKKRPVECQCKLVDDDVTNEDCKVHAILNPL